ncbi:MAG: hypothetical protein A4E48_01193 [Methanosaeta sp. PtaU1.Bin060]|nr:MAG: hypothetical protein A4E48_01193 [Methanosaeta sp. PtaU1.Bin060]
MSQAFVNRMVLFSLSLWNPICDWDLFAGTRAIALLKASNDSLYLPRATRMSDSLIHAPSAWVEFSSATRPYASSASPLLPSRSISSALSHNAS